MNNNIEKVINEQHSNFGTWIKDVIRNMIFPNSDPNLVAVVKSDMRSDMEDVCDYYANYNSRTRIIATRQLKYSYYKKYKNITLTRRTRAGIMPTEYDKIMLGKGDLYLYYWVEDKKPVAYCIISLDHIRSNQRHGLMLDNYQELGPGPSGDFYISIELYKLRNIGAILAWWEISTQLNLF
jgi:hypothetical protein